MVRLPGHRDYDKINAAYAYGGVAMAKQTVANLLRIPIHYYALVNWQGFIEVMNIIGGVDLYVDKDMHYEDPYADLVIDIKHGYQHLDGKKEWPVRAVPCRRTGRHRPCPAAAEIPESPGAADVLCEQHYQNSIHRRHGG
jgi:LCP family protein required for cell wall assembly